MRVYDRNTPSLDLSIIIPAYNSQKYVSSVIRRAVKVLGSRKLKYELLLIADGCTDDTLEVAEKEAKKYKGKVHVFGYEKNHGKGYAIVFGMRKAKGKVIGFLDCDEEINPKSVTLLYEVMQKKNADVVVGSKRHPKSRIIYPLLRRFVSFTYFMLVRILFDLGVSDTQAGVKIYKRAVVKAILPKLTIKGFAFDAEMLYWVRALGYKKIYDAPIYVDSSHSSDVSVLKSFGIIKEALRMFLDTLALFLKTCNIK